MQNGQEAYMKVIKEHRIIIAGSRDMDDYEIARKAVDMVLEEIRTGCPVCILSGHCRGADLLGERYAKEHGIRLALFPARWEQYGKRAGYVRNTLMAEYASNEDVAGCLIAFWDGKSRGTKMMIDIAGKKGIDIHVFDLEGRRR